LVAGNWKMHMLRTEAAALVEELSRRLQGVDNVEVVVCPPFTALESAAAVCRGTNIKLGAQNMHWEDRGAFTGEISPVMLKDAGCEYVIIGHSERRQHFCEHNDSVSKKVRAALKHGLTPIVCVGETLSERQSGVTDKVCRDQVYAGLEGLERGQAEKIVIAYEPVWAIGTGKSASSKDAEHVINYIRILLRELFGEAVSSAIRIQYGGSVKPENTEELMAQPNIDGALVGGASLQAESFAEIIRITAGE